MGPLSHKGRSKYDGMDNDDNNYDDIDDSTYDDADDYNFWH